jgi:hypothetical protein
MLITFFLCVIYIILKNTLQSSTIFRHIVRYFILICADIQYYYFARYTDRKCRLILKYAVRKICDLSIVYPT